MYKAKKNAEVKQGVGRETELGYLNKDGMKMINEKNLNILNEIYLFELDCGKTHEDLKKIKL